MTAENEPPTFSIARLDLRPGDVLVAKYPERLTLSQQENLRGWISDRIPAGISLLVLDNGADLAVLTAPAKPVGLACVGCGSHSGHAATCPVANAPAPPR